jgi:hypothetical protein
MSMMVRIPRRITIEVSGAAAQAAFGLFRHRNHSRSAAPCGGLRIMRRFKNGV